MVDGCVTSHIKALGRLKKRRRKEEVKNKVEKEGQEM